MEDGRRRIDGRPVFQTFNEDGFRSLSDLTGRYNTSIISKNFVSADLHSRETSTTIVLHSFKSSPMSLSNDKIASLRSSGGDTTGSSKDEVTAELRRMKQKQRERRLTDAVSVALSVLEGGSSMVEKSDDVERGRNLLQEEEGLNRVRRFANQGTSVLESKEISAMLLELNQKEAECVGGSRQSSKLRYQRRPFYSPPRQRQKWGDDVALQHSEWGDLFYDLFYVAAAYNLGNLLTSSLEPDLYKKGVMYFVAIFGSLYIAWEESVLYQSRYATGDYFHQLVNILRILFVSLSIIHIDPIYIMSDPSSADNVSTK